MKARENLWALVTNDERAKVLATAVQPDEPENSDETGWTNWVPVYAQGRVTGDRYQPYSGTSEWVEAANAAMASRANSNFRRNSGY